MLARQEITDDLANDRRAAQATAHQHFETDFAVRPALEVQADVMHFGSSAVGRRTGDGDFELARQVVELGVHRRPLADDLAVRPRIVYFIRRNAGEVIGRGVADAVATGLDGMHLDRRQVRQHVRHVFELGPVVLQVLAGREVTVVAVVLAGQVRQHAQLPRGQQAIGNGDAQHRRMGLDVQAVAQAQWLELILTQFAGQETARLVAELRDAFGHQGLVNVVVAVHGRNSGNK